MGHDKRRSDPSADDVARTLQVDDGASLRHRALAAAAERVRRPMCVVILGDDVGERARVVGASFTIGRSGRADLTLRDKRISSRHCRIEDRGDSFALIDLGSTNGTSVNGAAVHGERVLHQHDRIELGDTVVRFELQDAVDRAYDEAMQRLIHIDELTGLYQRRRFDRELDELLIKVQDAGSTLGLLVLDVDGLKGINDTHGHLFGAFVIAETGKLIGATIPDGAIAARFGGDEYVVACPDLDLHRTEDVAKNIHAAVAAHRYLREGVLLKPGISIGVAAFPEHASDATSLFSCGDRALYAAKRAGRNRVRVYEP
ncbi:MAG TPA: GGDEF domain-containing protein [Polyangiaceae bacterium]|nr:GGDEF domain-containing protein [Polyangiaceae bacterium]